jgi:hypothetical protein
MPGGGGFTLAQRDALRELELVGSTEGRRAEKGLPQGHAEGELVALRRRLLAQMLLRCHVRRGSHARARLGYVLAEHVAVAAGRLQIFDGTFDSCQAEVRHFDSPITADQYVVWLEVAVHEAGGVSGREAIACLEENQHLAPPVLLLRTPLPQGGAGHVLHGDENALFALADVEHRHDVRMREHRQGLRFAKQARSLRAARRVPMHVHQLDGDLAPEVLVERGVDHAHAPAAQLLEQQVPTEASSAILEEWCRPCSLQSARGSERSIACGIAAGLDARLLPCSCRTLGACFRFRHDNGPGPVTPGRVSGFLSAKLTLFAPRVSC